MIGHTLIDKLAGDVGDLAAASRLQRSSSSNRTAVSVLSSRYFTMTGA
jgi:hypothetical protein